jgi:hypothetical protein
VQCGIFRGHKLLSVSLSIQSAQLCDSRRSYYLMRATRSGRFIPVPPGKSLLF